MSQTFLSDYADYLSRQHIRELTEQNIRKLFDSKIPLTTKLSSLPEEAVYNYFYTGLNSFLRAMAEGNGSRYLQEQLKMFQTGEDTVIKPEDLLPEDLITLDFTRKELLIEFLEKYTADLPTYKTLLQEIEEFYKVAFIQSFRIFNNVEKNIHQQQDALKDKELLENYNELQKTRKALEISNSSLERKVKDRTNELSRINELNKIIAGQLDLKKIIQSVTDVTTELTKAQFGAFFYNLVNEKGESYTLYTISGVPAEHFSKFPMPRNTLVFHPTFHNEGIIRSEDITKDARYGKNDPHFGMPKGHLPVRSYLAVPVVSRTGEVLGGLFYGHEKPGVFTEEAENLVSAITTHAAIAIDNAKLFSALQYQSKLNKTITDNATSCLLMMNDKGFCTFMNPAGEKMFGFTFEEISQQPLHYMIHHHKPDGSHYPKEECPLDRALPENFDVRAHEDLFFRKDGSSFPVSCAASPIFENGVPIATVIEVRDITQEKDFEQTIITSNRQLHVNNQELERINKDLDNFIYTASHDLRAPVSNIEGLVYTLNETLSQDNPDRNELRNVVAMIEESVIKFKDTLTDLTEISKAQKDYGYQEKINLMEILEDVKFSIKNLIDSSGAVLEPSFEITEIEFAKPHLKSILFNLISNAIKYKHPDRLPVVKLKGYSTAENYILEVEDNGLGIAEQHLPKLFSMFKRFNNHVEGSGVGLYIVKRILENAGGNIEVKSKLNKGTLFKIYFKKQENL